MKKSIFLWSIGSLMILNFFSSCNKRSEDQTPVEGKSMNQLAIARNFNWATTREVSVTIIARDNQDNPLPNVSFQAYTASPDSGGILMFGGNTDASGMWSCTQPVPGYMTSLVVANKYVGLIREKRISIQDNKILYIFGGKASNPVVLKNSDGLYGSKLNGVYYIGSYNNKGVPNYLEPVNDPVDAVLLNDINAALPEYMSVPDYHPQYLANTVPNNLAMQELCDVWVTYITEGAQWRNSVGFFTFNTDSPPTSASAIDSIKIVFPNLSNSGSGGGLNPGNKVYIGRFPAGKSVGWVVFADGWNGSQVTDSRYRIYSIPALNPEPNPALKKHTVLLRDPTRYSVLFAFEDWRRDNGSDQDFNDGILYVKSNPVSGINTDGMPTVPTTQIDTDNDGVPDNQDDYPTDPTKAHDNWYPNKTGYSSLAFEDLWPGQGDYDFNDLVISYRFNQITNAQNKAVQIKSTLITEAMGAQLHNAFAFQIPIAYNLVQSVTGTDLRHGLITVGANGVETEQTNAVVVVYDDAYDRLPPPNVGIGSNTEKGAPYITPDTMHITIDLTEPVSLAQIGTPPYNPFIIVNGNRNREIHLPDNPPTDKVDGSEFGTWSDDSHPESNRYYKTATNLPWAINISDKFSYVYERQAVNKAYLKFNSWAESSGASYPDWYKVNTSEYRDNSKIYTH
ncbi:MAG: LruC domain-containing protein [Bacteroidales bacterium]|nr:LruC domain-containing protein [Bacteroidales bacterium]